MIARACPETDARCTTTECGGDVAPQAPTMAGAGDDTAAVVTDLPGGVERERLEPADLAAHRPRLLRAAYAMCGSRDDAEDLVQETFERVLRRPRFVQRDRDAAYLLRVLRNICGRQAPAAERRRTAPSPPEDLDWIVDPARGPELAMDAQLAYAAMAELSEPLRATIVAVDVVGLSYREAARSLRTRVGTMMSRLYRAREQVRGAGGVMSDRFHSRDRALLVQLADGSSRARRAGSRGPPGRDPGRRAAGRSPAARRACARGRASRRRCPRRAHGRPARCGWSRPVRWLRCCSRSRAGAAGRRPDGRARRRPRGCRAPSPAPWRRRAAAAVDGVAFPDWGREFGWRATGMRHDDLGGRPTATVFYEHMGHRLAYTIVSGTALPRPAGARTVERDGLRISLYRDPGHGGHDVAVFERGGRTCVVAGHVLELDTLLDLAAWKGDGRVRSSTE